VNSNRFPPQATTRSRVSIEKGVGSDCFLCSAFATAQPIDKNAFISYAILNGQSPEGAACEV